MMFTIREHEREAEKAWAKNNQEEVTLTKDVLKMQTVKQ